MVEAVEGDRGRRASYAAVMEQMNRIAAVVGLGVFVGGLVGCEISDKDIELVSIAEVRSLQQQAEKDPKVLLLVDPRAPGAYRLAHLPGATNMEFNPQMTERGVDPKVSSYKNIIVYGDNPGSAVARGMTKRLLKVGYEDVRLFAGGLEEWTALQYPLEEQDTAGRKVEERLPGGEKPQGGKKSE